MSDVLLENGDYSQTSLEELLEGPENPYLSGHNFDHFSSGLYIFLANAPKGVTRRDLFSAVWHRAKQYLDHLEESRAAKAAEEAEAARIAEAEQAAQAVVMQPVTMPVATLAQVRNFLDNFMRKYTCKLRKADAGLWLPEIMDVFKSFVLKEHGLVVEQGPSSLGTMICHRCRDMFPGTSLTPVRRDGGPTMGYENLKYKAIGELAEKSGHSAEILTNKRK